MDKISAVAVAIQKRLKENNICFTQAEDNDFVRLSIHYPETNHWGYISVLEDSISFGVCIPFTYVDRSGMLQDFITEKNNDCLYGRYTYDDERGETEFSITIVNRGDISICEIDTYLDYVLERQECDYQELLCIMGYKNSENDPEEDYLWFDDEETGYMEIPFGEESDPSEIYPYIVKGEYAEGAQILIDHIEEIELGLSVTGEDIDLIKSDIAFLIRFGKVLPSELKAPFDLDLRQLLKVSVEAGDAFSIANEALLEISLRRFDKATELLMRLDTRKKWVDLQEVWENILWDVLECSEGALIAWMVDMTYGRAGDEEMVKAAERDYEEYVNSDAFRRLRGRLYAIAVREAK